MILQGTGLRDLKYLSGNNFGAFACCVTPPAKHPPPNYSDARQLSIQDGWTFPGFLPRMGHGMGQKSSQLVHLPFL